MRIIYLLCLVLVTSCASNNVTSSNEDIIFIKVAEPGCSIAASLTSFSFSLIPPIASMLAKDILITKAKEYRANRVLITKNEGIFRVDIEATAYRCSDEKIKPSQKKIKKSLN